MLFYGIFVMRQERVKLHVNGKRHIQVANFSKIENEQIKTAQNNSYG